ncbi:MAG: hypothetical protein H6707_12460 [Deltaproteobacteria bacterium]|nr:hypothetical protein [Deltaproteobacteria bacterium]
MPPTTGRPTPRRALTHAPQNVPAQQADRWGYDADRANPVLAPVVLNPQRAAPLQPPLEGLQLLTTDAVELEPADSAAPRGWALQLEDVALIAVAPALRFLPIEPTNFAALISGQRIDRPLGIACAVAAFGLFVAVALRRANSDDHHLSLIAKHAWMLSWPLYGTLAYLAALSLGAPAHLAVVPLLVSFPLFRPLRRHAGLSALRRIMIAPATLLIVATVTQLAQTRGLALSMLIGNGASAARIRVISLALAAATCLVLFIAVIFGARRFAGARARQWQWVLRYVLFTSAFTLSLPWVLH